MSVTLRRVIVIILLLIVIYVSLKIYPVVHRFNSNPRTVVEHWVDAYNARDVETFFALHREIIPILFTSSVKKAFILNFFHKNLKGQLNRASITESSESLESLLGDDIANGDNMVYCQFNVSTIGTTDEGGESDLFVLILKKEIFGWRIVGWSHQLNANRKMSDIELVLRFYLWLKKYFQ